MPDFYHKFGAASPMAGVFLPSSPSIEQDGYGLLIYILDLSASRSLDVGSPNWDKMRFGALRTRQNEIMAFLEVWALGRSPVSHLGNVTFCEHIQVLAVSCGSPFDYRLGMCISPNLLNYEHIERVGWLAS
jgi:hypothetical protein